MTLLYTASSLSCAYNRPDYVSCALLGLLIAARQMLFPILDITYTGLSIYELPPGKFLTQPCRRRFSPGRAKRFPRERLSLSRFLWRIPYTYT